MPLKKVKMMLKGMFYANKDNVYSRELKERWEEKYLFHINTRIVT